MVRSIIARAATVLTLAMAVTVQAPAAHAADAAKPPLDVLGTLKAELDYRQRTWYLTARGEESESGFTGVDGSSSVTLFGNATPEGYSNVKDSLRISFDVLLMEGALVARNVAIRYTPANLANPYTAQRESVTRLRVDHVEMTDDTLIVSGSFHSELDFQPGLNMLLGGDLSPTGGAGLIAGALTEGERKTRDLVDGQFIAEIPRKR
ncbi:MAG: hypothetical protein AAFW01_06660 [Pseudomonadota bacterium]